MHPRADRTLAFDSAGVDELGVVPWPILLRRRLRARIGIDPRWAVLWVVLSGLFTTGFTITSSGSARPRRSDSTPSTRLKVLTIGMLPPSRMRTGSAWNEARRAFCAASPNLELGLVT